MKKIIKEWMTTVRVGVWEAQKCSVTLYPAVVIVREPYIRWVDTTGSLAKSTSRYINPEGLLAVIKKWHRKEQEDNMDYTQEVMVAAIGR